MLINDFLTIKQNFGLSVAFRIAVLILCVCSVFFIQAEAASVSQQEILQAEEKAAQMAFQWQEDSVRQSLELFRESAEKWESLNKPAESARCLREAARLKLLLSEEKSALPLLKKSLQIEQASRNLEGEAETLSLLTVVLTRLNENAQSSVYHAKALEKARQSKNPKQMAVAFAASGLYYYGQRDFKTMLDQQEKALKLFQEIGDIKSEAEILIDLAYSYTINNDRIRGRDTALKALEISKNSGNLRCQALSMIALGDAYQRMGESENALNTLLEAQKLFVPDLDLFEKAVLYNRLGHYFQSYNKLDEAKKHFQISYSLFERADSAEGRSETLSVLGRICFLQDELDEALQYFNQSRVIAEESGDAMPLALVNLRIGEVNLKLADYSEAEKNLRDSLFYYQKLGVKYRIAEVQEKLGLIYEKSNNYTEAENKYMIALDLNKKVHSKFAQAQTLFNLARLKMLQNENADAFRNIEESIKLTESSNNETANSNLKQAYFSNVFDRYELYIHILMKMHRQSPDENYAVRALQAAEKSRARLMLEYLLLSEANFTKDADAETVRREKEIRALLNTKADKLTDLLSGKADKSETGKISGEISELELELEEIKAKLKQQSPVYSAIKNPAPFDVGEFQKNILDDDTLLLEFSFGEEESYLWLLGKKKLNSFVLPPREQIEAKIQTLRELLAAHEKKEDEEIETYQARIVKADEDYRQISKQLSDEIFGQVAGKFGNKRLLIVPDGKLNYFPVSALPLPNSDNNEPILLTNEVVYEPSASTLSILAKSQNQITPASKNLLVFSDPVFTNDDSRILANEAGENPQMKSALPASFRFVESLDSLARLPASKTEADSIIGILGTSKTDNYSGFSANRERLLNANASDYKILHLATHGLINEEHPELSGIVLSRFGENGQKLDEFVRLQDIYGMNLSADLVVLSACETGIGKQVRGEGLMSLNNAFLSVGAKSVMSSLWKVEDNATLELMKNFYSSLADEKVTPSKALQKAQIKMWGSGQYKSPFYWAAFTVQGDYKRVPNLTRDFNYSILFSAASVFLISIAVFWFFRRRKKRV